MAPLPSGTFKPHGKVHVSLEPQLTVSRVEGPWNRELVKAWMDEFAQRNDAMLKLGPHAGITIISGSALATADALQLMRKAMAHGKAHYQNYLSCMVVGPGVTGQALTLRMFAPVFEGIVPFATFGTEQEARAWCADQLARWPGGLAPTPG